MWLRGNEMKKVVIWGTGRICELFLKIYNPQKVQIVAFIDSDTNKQREKIEGIQIYAPEKIGGFSTDYIIIASAYYSEIKERLMNEKVEEEKVIDFYSVYRRLCPLTNIVWNEILNSEIYQGLITQENRAIEDYEMKELARKKLFLSAKQLISTMPNGRIRSLEEPFS